MTTRTTWTMVGLGAAFFLTACWSAASACCPAPPPGSYAINADQTVVILWDAARKTQHFIRQASFRSEADDFGFLIPSPTPPELAESGNDAFPYLATLTRPAIEYRRQPQYVGCGCADSGSKSVTAAGGVNVLLEQRVAGFDAVVLDASSADSLTAWLKDHGYAYSPQIAAWAEPYVAQGWKITALKVAKNDDAAKQSKVEAGALRMSFATDAPLFPYREPDYGTTVKSDTRRTLRIFFLAEARYGGALGPSVWSGRPVWSDVLSQQQRAELLTRLNLPPDTGPAEMRLTEFEDDWAYRVAPADVQFTVAKEQDKLHRPPVVEYVQSTNPLPDDATAYLIVAGIALLPTWRLRRKTADGVFTADSVFTADRVFTAE